MGRHSTLENWMFPFLFYEVSFICIHNNIFFIFLQGVKKAESLSTMIIFKINIYIYKKYVILKPLGDDFLWMLM